MTLAEQIAYLMRVSSDTANGCRNMDAAILTSLLSLEAAERDAFDLRQAAKLVILGDMVPDFVSLNINKNHPPSRPLLTAISGVDGTGTLRQEKERHDHPPHR